YGAPMEQILQELRQAIIKDRQFEIKFSEDSKGGFIQFILVSCITWLFLLICQQMIQIQIPEVYQWAMAGLQIMGICFYPMANNFLRKKLFYPFPPYIFTLTTLQSLCQAEMPLGLILKRSELAKLPYRSPLHNIYNSIENLIEDWQTHGVPVQNRLNDLLREIWFLQNTRFDLFLKISKLLKFFCLAAFFLSSYLLFLYSLADSFLP
ncbi:MAG: hypothetical protein OXB84_05050, partial [Halobacteriovoraceae bacterium]|nr:hypothetical protein [Halobacteriovoraceae bacterium]